MCNIQLLYHISFLCCLHYYCITDLDVCLRILWLFQFWEYSPICMSHHQLKKTKIVPNRFWNFVFLLVLLFFSSPICDLFVAFGICVKVIYRKIIINGNQEKNIYTVLYCTHIYHKTGLQCISPISNISIEPLSCDESFWCFFAPHTYTLCLIQISTRNLFIIRLFYLALFALSFDLFIYSDMYLLYN